MADTPEKHRHHHHHHTDAEKEKKRQKALRRMEKILTKAWELSDAEPFQMAKHSSTSSILCLTSLGQKVDEQRYSYGKHGWEDFARDIGGIYNRHLHRKTKHAKTAQTHLQQVCAMLAEKDSSLVQVARNAPAPIERDRQQDSSSGGKKRKSGTDNGGDAKRRSSSANNDKKTSAGASKENTNDLTISEREAKALEALSEFIESKGGDAALVQNYRCRVTKKPSDGRYDINYYNEQGRRFRSMVEVGRFLNLVDDTATRSAAVGKMKKRKRGSAPTAKETLAEKKKLRRELDRLRKQFSRASKSLDDFMTGDKEFEYPVDDALLLEDTENGKPRVLPTNCPAARIPDIRSFSGLPDHCIPDVLQAWDFLCTFSRTISLEPIPLDDFVQCLTYRPPSKLSDSDIWKCPPVYLGEAHLALLKLIFSDASSDEWWWSILETEETENAVLTDPNVDVTVKEEESELPLIKVNFAALLADEEDPSLTSSWLQELQSIRKIKASDAVELKRALNTAKKLMANKWASAYTRKALQLGRTSGPGFMKRAMVWLYDKVTEAKPELSKQRSGSRTTSEAMKKRATIVEEVSQQMEKLSSAALTVTDDDLLSDAEEDDEEEESDDEEEQQIDEKERLISPAESNEEDKIASYIPPKPSPSLVDFLLPPGKPIPPTELVGPATWPQLAGAAGCRIIHRYKRLRNEVDDALRRFRELSQLTVRERRQRERLSTGRTLSEFVTVNGSDGPTERACELLNAGRDYLELSPLERLALLRVLIEAAYDTVKIYEVVDSNHKQRTNAAKALFTEQRRANKEAKEKAAADEAAARQDLAAEARNNFLEEKREEIRKLNENNLELTIEEIETLTEQDILDFDEDIKADFDALPTPESFKKAEVVDRIAKIQEAAAFETELLIVVTMDELVEKEKQNIASMEQYLEELGGEEALMDPGTERSLVRKIEKLRRDIQKAQEATEYLPGMRAEATEALKDAIADGTIKSLRGAIRQAKIAKLFFPDNETNGVVALDVVRDAHMELENAKHLKRVADAQKDLVSKMNKCFIRTDPVGTDRFRNALWRFEYGDQSHIWVEVNPVLNHATMQLKNEPGYLKLAHDDVSEIVIGPADIEEDFPPTDASESKDRFRIFSRREYHQSGAAASLVKREWGCHVNESSIRALMKGLDSRGIRENSLKKNLKEALEEKTTSAEAVPKETSEADEGKIDEEKTDDVGVTKEGLETSGDEDCFAQAKKSAVSFDSDIIDHENLQSIKESAIGQQARVRIVVESTKEGEIARYENGSVTAWKKKKEAIPVTNGETEFEPQMRDVLVPYWRISLDNSMEFWMSGNEVIECIVRFHKWKRQDADYFEHDSTFLSYRNNLGRHCGKAAEAPQAMLPIRFGLYMVKREAELYQRLKIISLDNNWGGKSGTRNAWITSMRDYAFEFQTVKEGLLTLEKAFFELIGGTLKENPDGDKTAKELLENPLTREDIELESMDVTISGLWNSKASRDVFLEIVSKCETIGFLSLAFELLCRNTMAFIEAHRIKSGLPAVAQESNNLEQYAPLPMRTTRRMNAWQQQQQAENQSFWDPPAGRRTRRTNAWQSNQDSWDY
ncbi:DDT domain containing protein [Nitzschia inconspicua]|uniref:DDT domain containing protein n=1 Tax=Nitzschia inconspicua TaxID=303405 RepID=A0A9K3PML6_9STRA|nr:DDT domain containing protein [Nitzschia inconspicua]